MTAYFRQLIIYLSIFIKFMSISALIFLTFESKNQIKKILLIYADELSDKEKSNLNQDKNLVFTLFIAEIIMAVLYLITFTLKFLNVKKQNYKISNSDNIKGSNYNMLNTNNTDTSHK